MTIYLEFRRFKLEGNSSLMQKGCVILEAQKVTKL
jgi:hypothetical protein